MEKQLSVSFEKGLNSLFRLETKWYHFVHRHKEEKDYPIVINNFNRLEWLQQQIDWLESVGQRNIIILDNLSNYPPLLDFYQRTKHLVIRLNGNVGHEAFWRTHVFQRFGKYFHVYTDPDVLPTSETPKDFMFYFKSLLDEFNDIQKVGFGMKRDDIPDFYPKKKEVLDWENSLDQEEVKPQVFRSKVDTTFALYRPGAMFQCWERTLRTGGNYALRHMPWYEDPKNLSEESINYLNTTNSSSSWYNTVLGKDSRYSAEK